MCGVICRIGLIHVKCCVSDVDIIVGKNCASVVCCGSQVGSKMVWVVGMGNTDSVRPFCGGDGECR